MPLRVLAVVHNSDPRPGDGRGARRYERLVRELGHELDEWQAPHEPHPPRDLESYDAVISFGGGMHVDQGDLHPWLHDERKLMYQVSDQVPFLGICLGAQQLALAHGATVEPLARPELGWHDVELTEAGRQDPLLSALPSRFGAFEWHRYHFTTPPEGECLARGDACVQAFRAGYLSWGVQFHPEVDSSIAREWLVNEDDEVLDHLGLNGTLERDLDQRMSAWTRYGRALGLRFLAIATAATSARRHLRAS